MDDPDAAGRTWDHWVLFNLPFTERGLPEHQPTIAQLPNGSTQGQNSWRRTGYGGPCPPSGPAHTYRFIIYAVDRSLILPVGPTKFELQAALAGHILAESLLTATYQRPGTGGDDDDGGDAGGNGGGGY